jgi:membrane-bound lytic murein transglycosylase D
MHRRAKIFLRRVAFLTVAMQGAQAHAADAGAARPTLPAPAPTPRTSAPASAPAARRATTNRAPASKPSSSRATRTPDPGARRQVAGGSTSDDVALGVESAELRALRDAERELFPASAPPPGAPWPGELASPIASSADQPRVHASGLPPSPVPSTPPAAEGGKDLSWMSRLQLPELPVRWEPRLVRYLEFFKDDPRGRALLTVWLRRSGRYREAIRRTLRKKGLPEDLLWLAMTESGFDPGARSPVGALGLWQFMPDTGRQYGLGQDRWIDYRLSAPAATEAASEFLADLHRRFGSWELAIAAYNMGYTGILSAVRKYNTNDFWALSRMEGALPWETSLYVPKIIAASIVARNLGVFGFADLALEPAVESDEVAVPPGTSLASVAQATGSTTKEIETLNLELRASRTPPADPAAAPGDPASMYPVKVPLGKGAQATQSLAKLRRDQAPLERYVVRFGENLEQIAVARGVLPARLIEVNGITQGEVVRGGTVLLMPKGASPASPSPSTPATGPSGAPVVIVPSDLFVYPDRRRVFYRVLAGDTLRDVASAFKVSVDELRRWNEIDPAGRLVEGMTLQIFVLQGADLTRVLAMNEGEVRPLAIGSEDFFAYWEAQKKQKRITLTAKAGDTLDLIGRRYGVSGGWMERINRRGRNEKLAEGDAVVVYVPFASPALARGGAVAGATAGPTVGATSLENGPEPLGPIPAPPAPDNLPRRD